VIHLAGENVGVRWTHARKRRIRESRVSGTRLLAETIARLRRPPRVLISASATGIYGDRGDETLDESSPRGDSFLADLVDRWETAARDAEPLARLVIVRFGVVLGPDGGALKQMLLPFKLGAGGPIGNGRQWMSWVDREDALRVVEWAIDNERTRGIYNATAPEPVRNRDFARALGRALHRPAILPAPAFALRLAFGEMAEELLLAGQRVLPKRTTGDGFMFERATLESSLAAVIRAASG